MKKLGTIGLSLMLTTLVAPLFVSAQQGVRINPDFYDTDDLDYCNADELLPNLRPLHGPKPLGLCYTVKSGDTLWGIAKRYYKSGFRSDQLIEVSNPSRWHDGLPWPPDGWHPYTRITNPKQLKVGSKVRITIESPAIDSSTGEAYGTWGDPPGTSVFTLSGLSTQKRDKRYDGPFSSLLLFIIDRKTNNKIYIVSSGGWGSSMQLIVNKERNPHIGSGANFDLFTSSPDGKRYAVRTNVRQDVPDPGFIVLSNMGNGPEYDFSDSLIWYDDDTLVYRAQSNDEWRVVVNHRDYKAFDFLENLRVESGVVKFDARHNDGFWTKESFTP